MSFLRSRFGATSGPNHVLVWVLQRAHALLGRFADEAGTHGRYSERIATAAKALSGARRINTIAQAISESDHNQYPSPQSLTQAAASRKRLYRLPHVALHLLRMVEDGNPEAIVGMLRETLVAPLHRWQAFELALALGMEQPSPMRRAETFVCAASPPARRPR